MEVLARSLKLCLLLEICNIADERFSFPMAKCVSISLADMIGQMRAVRNWDQPAETLSLADVIIDPDGTRRLHNPCRTSKCSGLKQNRQTISKAALWST